MEGLSGVYPVADDILIVGEGAAAAEATASHDRRMREFLQRCQVRNIKLNAAKFRFKVPSLQYVGHVLTSDGLRVDPQKIRAIREMPSPTDVAGVRRLLGIVNYLARFLPNLADKCTGFRRLTQKDVVWQWGESEEADFRRLKDELPSPPLLRYFDSRLPVTVQSDAPGEGLGAVLMQKGQSCTYPHRGDICPDGKRTLGDHIWLGEVSPVHLRSPGSRGGN